LLDCSSTIRLFDLTDKEMTFHKEIIIEITNSNPKQTKEKKEKRKNTCPNAETPLSVLPHLE